MPRVLIVEDEPDIGSMVAQYLDKCGHVCEWVPNSIEAQQRLAGSLPDIVLLDWMLPGRSGYEFARLLRTESRTKHLPIIMLTARDDEVAKVNALDVGADDYVTKPFSLAELGARINALLRRSSPDEPEATVELAGLTIDRNSRRVSVMDTILPMGRTEFELLFFLMTNVERVYSRTELIQYLWDPRTRVEERTIDVHIRRLRMALRETGHDRLIQTVRGAGYRFSIRG